MTIKNSREFANSLISISQTTVFNKSDRNKQLIDVICEASGIDEPERTPIGDQVWLGNLANVVLDLDGESFDGYHTFNELYHHRALLFLVICRAFKSRAWKSKKHYDGSMYDDMFIVGIDTPTGQATYHYDVTPYWEMFDVKELDRAPEWDGHTADDAINRIVSLSQVDSSIYPINVTTWQVIWTGEYPNLCSGHWEIYRNGEKLDVDIPFQGHPANTYGSYSRWWFDENWMEQFEEYQDGLEFSDWVDENIEFLKTLTGNSNEYSAIYKAFQGSDWRYDSCGGCI